jgi:hypothetical protein
LSYTIFYFQFYLRRPTSKMTKTLRTCAKDQHQMVQVLLCLDWLPPNSYKNLKTKP